MCVDWRQMFGVLAVNLKLLVVYVPVLMSALKSSVHNKQTIFSIPPQILDIAAQSLLYELGSKWALLWVQVKIVYHKSDCWRSLFN